MRALMSVFVLFVLCVTTLVADEKQWKALDEAALQAANSGQLDEARKLADEAVTMARREFGNDDVRTAGSLALLAEMLMAQGKWPEAEAKLREAGAIREKKLKPGHPDLEQTDNLMGRVLAAQGRFEEAERLHLRALAAAEKAAERGEAGPAAPRWTDVVATLDLLATFYDTQKDAKASEMRKRAVETLGRYARSDKEDHLLRLEELARNAVRQAAYDDAEKIIAEQLRLSESYFGNERLATNLQTFAAMFEEELEYGRATPLYRRLASIQEKSLGGDHPDFASSLHKLGVLLGDQQQYEEAEPLLTRALAIREKALGKAHPDVASTLHALASLHMSQRDYVGGTPFLERALAIREKTLDANDPLLATTLHDLARAYFVELESAKAGPLFKRALAIREKSLGPDHVDVGWSLSYLGWFYEEEKEYAKAESLYLRSMEVMEKAYGPEDSTVGDAAKNLARLYRAMGRVEDAEKFEKRAAAIH